MAAGFLSRLRTRLALLALGGDSRAFDALVAWWRTPHCCRCSKKIPAGQQWRRELAPGVVELLCRGCYYFGGPDSLRLVRGTLQPPPRKASA